MRCITCDFCSSPGLSRFSARPAQHPARLTTKAPHTAGLNAYFRGNYELVEYWGKEWSSQWFAVSPERPLPSRTWYYAYPHRDLISTDGTAYWKWAEIKVHCWVYRRLYVTVIHYDPIDFGGYVSTIPTDPSGGCAGGEYMTSIAPTTWRGPHLSYETQGEHYDPYDPGCGESGGGGGGDGDGSGEDTAGETGTFAELCSSLGGTLYYDYVCLEQWNEKTGDYETIWCGTAAICET